MLGSCGLMRYSGCRITSRWRIMERARTWVHLVPTERTIAHLCGGSDVLDSGVASRGTCNWLRGTRACKRWSRACEQRQRQEGLQSLEAMWSQGFCPPHVLYGLLRACTADQDVLLGRMVHSFIIRSGLETDAFWGNHLIRMYASCGSLEEANQVFGKISAADKFVWAAIIAANGKLGEANAALKLYDQMRCSSVEPNEHVYVAVLNACATAKALATGKLVHSRVLQSACRSSVFVGNSLVDMYAKCGMVGDARQVFDTLETKDLFTWNIMITGYALHSRGEEAGELFYGMQQEGQHPDRFTLLGVLKGWATLGALDHARLLHAYILQKNGESDEVVVSTLICMYARCGSLEDSRRLFDSLNERDIVTWSAMIAAYAGNDHAEEALQLFQQMQAEGVEPDNFVLSSILKACSSLAALDLGKLVHAHVLKNGYESDIFIANTLIDFYGKCGSLRNARDVFDRLLTKDRITWTTLITGYAQHGDVQEALLIFHQMLEEGVEPDKVTHASILRACASIGALDEGKLHHACIVECDTELDAFISNILIDMYAKCGSPEDARIVFDKLHEKGLVTWNSMISAYVQHGNGQEAVTLFQQMQMEGLQPDKILVTNILGACASTGSLDQGKLLHAHAVEHRFLSDPMVGSSIVDMYMKCGSLVDARTVFDRLSNRDAVSWSTIIAGYAQDGGGQEVLHLFQSMQQEGICPDKVTLASILKACSNATALYEGKALHRHIIASGFESDLFISSALIDMYATCGSLDDARRVFDRLPNKSSVSWNALIAGYAQHGESQMALQLFHQMLQGGAQPDRVTFVSLLSACSYSCLLDEGMVLFRAMSEDFGINTDVDHLGCMVDLLGRAGRLYEAEELIIRMSSPPDIVVWTTLLGACRMHGNLMLGSRCFEAILELDMRNSAAYALMSGMYADAGKWEDRSAIRLKMLNAGVRKEPGRTWMEFDNMVHTFVVDDQSHRERKQIYDKLRSLTRMIA